MTVEDLPYALPTSTSAMEMLKATPHFCDLVIKYKSNELEIERPFNKTVLIMQSQYFFSSLVTFNNKLNPAGLLELDLTECPFQGQAATTDDFYQWFTEGIVFQIYEASKYFMKDSLTKSLGSFLKYSAFDRLKETESSTECILKKVIDRSFLNMLTDDSLCYFSLKQEIYKFLCSYLGAHLKDYIHKIPAQVLGELLEKGLGIKDHKATFSLYMDAYESMLPGDQEFLKPRMLDFFDFEELDEADISRLANSPGDYRRIYSKLSTQLKRIQAPFTLLEKFIYRDNDDNLKVEIPFEYEGHTMCLELTVSCHLPDCLCLCFYRNAAKMTDRIPEYTYTVTDLKTGNVVEEFTVKKNGDYSKAAREHIKNKDARAEWGDEQAMTLSDLEDSQEYELKLEFLGFAYLDE